MSSIELLAGLGCAPPLTGKTAPWMRQLLGRSGFLNELVGEYGSPLHLFVADEFDKNVDLLLEPLTRRGLAGDLFFARKANKLPWFVEKARDKGIGVDTASLEEMEETLALFLPPEKIVLTAIGKSKTLISRAIAAGVLIVLDNNDELALVRRVARALGKKARIGLRFSGFELAEERLESRFGWPIEDAPAVFDMVLDSQDLELEVLHAHLDRYEVRDRVLAAVQLCELSDLIEGKGHKLIGIDIGGGIPMCYLESEPEWRMFLEALKDVQEGECDPFTYGGELFGPADLYPAWSDIVKERFIEAILDNSQSGRPLHKELSSRGLKIFFEPGRCLLDNAGVTAASVMFRKRDSRGNLLIGMAMNRMQLRPFRAEFCVDPLPVLSELKATASEGAFMVGCLCSESDFIYRRRLWIPHIPEPEDLFLFANTGGYLAHHMEIGTHGGPLPKNLLLDCQSLNVLDCR